MVQLLLLHGANPDIRNKAGYTPMVYVRQYNYDKIGMLLENNR